MLARRLFRLLGPLCVMLGACVVRAAETDPPDPEAPQVRARTALILFVSYRGNLPVVPDPTRVRRTATGIVADALTGPELEVVTYPAIEPAMREWRVRSERDLGFGFLEELETGFEVETVVVGTLIVTPDRIVLLIREFSLQGWDLRRAEILEDRTNTKFWGDPEQAQLDLEVVVGRAVRSFTGTPPREPVSEPGDRIVVLPLRPVGTGRGYASLAMHGLLEALLASGRWTVADPALTAHTLRAQGLDPLALGRTSRTLLAERFGAELLLVPRLTAFPETRQTPAEFDADSRVGIGPSFTEGIGTPFHLSFASVDRRTGNVLTVADTYLAPDNPYGTFGRQRHVPLAQRFREGAKDLVERLLPEGRN